MLRKRLATPFAASKQLINEYASHARLACMDCSSKHMQVHFSGTPLWTTDEDMNPTHPDVSESKGARKTPNKHCPRERLLDSITPAPAVGARQTRWAQIVSFLDSYSPYSAVHDAKKGKMEDPMDKRKSGAEDHIPGSSVTAFQKWTNGHYYFS